MVTDHLNDELIQEFLDGNVSSRERFEIQGHLQSCRQCREAVTSYQELYDVLVEDADIELSKNFTRKVLRQTHRQAVGSVQFGLMQVFFVLAAIIVIVNVLFYYSDLTMFENSAKTTAAAFTGFIPKISEAYHNLFAHVQFDGLFIVLTAVGLLGLFLLDRLVLQPRFKTSP